MFFLSRQKQLNSRTVVRSIFFLVLLFPLLSLPAMLHSQTPTKPPHTPPHPPLPRTHPLPALFITIKLACSAIQAVCPRPQMDEWPYHRRRKKHTPCSLSIDFLSRLDIKFHMRQSGVMNKLFSTPHPPFANCGQTDDKPTNNCFPTAAPAPGLDKGSVTGD